MIANNLICRQDCWVLAKALPDFEGTHIPTEMLREIFRKVAEERHELGRNA